MYILPFGLWLHVPCKGHIMVADYKEGGALNAPLLESLLKPSISVLKEPSIRGVEATNAAVTSVLNSSGSISRSVAVAASGLFLDIANASKSIPGGIQLETASAMLESAGLVLEVASSHRQLSAQLRAATSAIGEAALNAASIGETITAAAPGGLELTLKKDSRSSVANKASQVGAFRLPALGDKVLNGGMRRLKNTHVHHR